MILSARHRPSLRPQSLVVCDDVICPPIKAKNIGVTMDSFLLMEEHIINMCKSTKKITKIRKHLITTSAETLVRALGTDLETRLWQCVAIWFT